MRILFFIEHAFNYCKVQFSSFEHSKQCFGIVDQQINLVIFFLGIGVPLAREHILLWFWWLPPADATYRSAQIRRGVHALLPGIVLPIIVALLACWLESLLPIHLIGSAVIAMFIGMFLNQFVRKTDVFATGLKFTSKKILKFAIILLGLSLNITTILHVGQMSLTLMVFTLLTCFGGGYFIGKALGLNWKLSI